MSLLIARNQIAESEQRSILRQPTVPADGARVLLRINGDNLRVTNGVVLPAPRAAVLEACNSDNRKNVDIDVVIRDLALSRDH